MDEWLCSRGEMRDFTKRALALGVNYIGICCGSMSHSLRVMAEELDKEHAASVFAPNMELNYIFGKQNEKANKTIHRQFPMMKPVDTPEG